MESVNTIFWTSKPSYLTLRRPELQGHFDGAQSPKGFADIVQKLDSFILLPPAIGFDANGFKPESLGNQGRREGMTKLFQTFRAPMAANPSVSALPTTSTRRIDLASINECGWKWQRSTGK